jgi:intein/homing endonuclease
MALEAFFGPKNKKPKEEEILPIFPEQIYEAAVLELKDILAPSALEINSAYVKLGEKLCRTFFIISYPRFLALNWFSPIINLDKVFDISIFIHPIDTAGIMRQLQKKVAEVQSQIHMREEKGLVRDPALDIAYTDLEALRDKLQQAQEKLFSLGIYITIYADSMEELDKVETEIRSILEARLVYIRPALFQQADGLNSVLPFGTDKLLVHSKLNSAPLSSVFPFVSFDLTSNKGILFGINRHNNSLVLFDRFSLENYNSVIFAKAGAGKSLKYDQEVLVKQNQEIKLVKIGSLVEGIIKKRGLTKIDEELEGAIEPGVMVYSFGKDLKGGWSKVTVAARKKASDIFYKFKTRSGREITTTEDHNIIILKNGKVVAAKSSEIQEGEFVPLPRFVSLAENPQKFINLLKVLKNSKRIYIKGAEKIIQKHRYVLKKAKIDNRYDRYLYKYRENRRIPIKYFWKVLDFLKIEPDQHLVMRLKITSKSGKSLLPAFFPFNNDFLKILGYIVSEGTTTKNIILISNYDQEVINDIALSLKSLNVLFYKVQKGLAIAERPFSEILAALGAKGKSQKKKVLSSAFNLKSEALVSYLKAYFEGDGGVEKCQISAVSKSKQLISGISYLLYYFGIVARISKIQKKASHWRYKKTYWRLTISGQENLQKFSQHINFASQRKRNLLKQIIQKQANTNVNIVPGIQPLFEELHQLFSSQLHSIDGFSEIKLGRRNASPGRLKNIVHQIEKKVEDFKALKEYFGQLAQLPTLETIIEIARNDNLLNRKMWQILGSSWPVIKNQEVQPGPRNVLRILETINGEETISLDEIKTSVHTGFKEMDLLIQEFNPSLQSALTNRPKSNASYEMLQKAGQFIWEQYREMFSRIPRIEKILFQLKTLANADLFWDPIVKIEKLINTKEKYVYDLTVDNEVFLAGQAGMFVHNSYATKLEILRSLMFDADIIVIDPEREYEYLAQAVDGRYFNISLTSEHHINPFDLPIPREDESSADILRSNIINLVGLFRILLGGLTPEEDSILDRAITETYASRDITADSDFSKVTPPILSDLALVLANMEGGESLAQRLQKYTIGTWAGFINQPTNVDINQKFIVFSIRDMEDELRPAAMYIITHYIWTAIRQEKKKRLLVIDEAWWMMKHEDAASFLFGLAKRARKYYLGVATITQDVGDFLKSPYGVPIITNSSLQLLLKQSPATIDLVKETFNLTDEEKFLLLESDVGEGIFFAGLKHVAIKIVASYTEDQIITSDPAQLLAIKKAKQEFAMTQDKSEARNPKF